MKTARQILGEKVKAWREAAGLSILQLAAKMGTKRTFIYDIEAGRKNFTIDYWDKLLRACGVSAERAMSGFTGSDIDPEYQDYHRMLGIIVGSGDPDLVHGIHVNLDAISDKALRLKKGPGPPRPQPRVGQEGEGGTAARSGRDKATKKKTA